MTKMTKMETENRKAVNESDASRNGIRLINADLYKNDLCKCV